MSAACRDILLDSSAYFRLGNSIHPLLNESFGTSPKHELFVLAELDDEYATNVRLQHKFEWVCQTEYRNDRRAKRYQLQGDDHWSRQTWGTVPAVTGNAARSVIVATSHAACSLS